MISARQAAPLGFTWRVSLPTETDGGFRAIDVNADECVIYGNGQLVFWEWEGMERKCILASFAHFAYRSVTILNPDGTQGAWAWAADASPL